MGRLPMRQVADAQAARDAAPSEFPGKPQHKHGNTDKDSKDKPAQPDIASIAAAAAQPIAENHKAVATGTGDAPAVATPAPGPAKPETPAPHDAAAKPAAGQILANAATLAASSESGKPGLPPPPVEGHGPQRDAAKQDEQDKQASGAARPTATTSAQTDSKAAALARVLGADGAIKTEVPGMGKLLAQARMAANPKTSTAPADTAGKAAAGPRAATAQRHAAELAAALAKPGAHETQTAKPAAPQPAAPVHLAKAADSQSGSPDGDRHDNGKGAATHTDAPNAKPAAPAPAATQTQFQLPPNAQSASADPSGGQALTAQPAAGAPAHVAASLHVAPQSAAQPGGNAQPVPLTDLGALALSIAAHSKDGARHFDIALHPADLGSIQVHLSVDHAGAAQAHVRADNQQTLQFLQRDAHHLERALKDAGLNLSGGGLNFSLKGQQHEWRRS